MSKMLVRTILLAALAWAFPNSAGTGCGKPPRAPSGMPAGCEAQMRASPSAGHDSGPPGADPLPFEPIPSFAALAPSAEAADPVVLTVSKSGSGPTLTLGWSGGTSPHRVSYSSDPSFQSGVKTLGAALSSSSWETAADSTKNLECFDVTDAEGVSAAVRGMGFDPEPAPTVPVVVNDGLWWGDSLSLDSGYLDLIPAANTLGLYDLPVNASAVQDAGNGYAGQATFAVPDDARGAYAFVTAHGQTSPASNVPLIHLYPRGLSSYSGIRAVVYANQTGHVWVAANGTIDELDVFQHDPSVVRSIAVISPYLSRVTNDGRALYVDAASPTAVYEIDVSTGAVSLYANVTGLPRTPLPVGLAVRPDGTACYFADASPGAGAGRLVKVPENNASALTDNYGAWPYWTFPDPCGMEVGLTGRVYASDSGYWIGYAPNAYNTYWSMDTLFIAHELEVDRDVSTASYDRYYAGETRGAAMAYNRNPIGSSRAESSPARYHGGDVIAQPSGLLSVEPLWEYRFYSHYPTAVILNTEGHSFGYPSALQTQDRIVQCRVRGWQGVKVHLRLVDPRDMAPYAPAEGWPAKGGKTAVPPYEAYDNDVWNETGYTDFGLTTSSSGVNPTQTLDVTPGADHTATFYLKLPHRYAGDNWAIEVTKWDPKTSAYVPEKVPMLSTVYTGWKRVYVERDRMFRRGGVLFSNASVGNSFVILYKNPDDSAWDNLTPGDRIAIFDTSIPFEGGHDEAYVGSITDVGSSPPYQRLITLVTERGGATPYTLTRAYAASPETPATHWPDFTQGCSAGVGVVNSNDGVISDTDTNQINDACSAFYDADLRDIQQALGDALVEFVGPRDGMGAVPFMSSAFYSGYELQPGVGTCENQLLQPMPGYDFTPMRRFAWAWTGNRTMPNYFRILGGGPVSQLDSCPSNSCSPPGALPQYLGISFPESLQATVLVGAIRQLCPPEAYEANAVREVGKHECGHDFRVNPSASLGHDSRCGWPSLGALLCSDTDPACDAYQDGCIMNPARNIWTKANRFDRFDLECGDSACPDGTPGCCQEGQPGCSVPGNGSIRQLFDPVTGVAP